MNLLNVHVSYPPNIGGVDTIMYHLCNELALRDHKVTVLTKSLPGAPFAEKIKGVEVLRVEYFPHFDSSTAPLLSKTIEKLVEKKKIDVVTFWNVNTWCLAGLQKSSFPKRCLIPIDILPNPIFRFIAGNPIWDGLIALTDYVKTELPKYGVAREKTTMIPPGLNLDVFNIGKTTPDSSGHLVLLCPARPDPIKGHGDLIKAFSEVKKKIPKLRLLLLAPSSIWWHTEIAVKKQISTLVRNLGLQQDVLIEDTAGIEDMPHYYSLSDVVVLPSYSESVGMVMLEAMASSRPVIGTDTSTVRGYIEKSNSGFYYTAGDWKELSFRLEELFARTDIRRKFGENGRSYVHVNHDVRKTAQKVESFYNSL